MGGELGFADTAGATDTPPWYAGADLTLADNSRCSTGIPGWVKNKRVLLTAAHCQTSGHVYNGQRVVGEVTAHDTGLDVAVITTDQDTAARFYSGPWNSGDSRPLYGPARLDPGQYACFSGAVSGFHCELEVTRVGVHSPSGRTAATEVRSRSGGVAVAQGDSGGPAVANPQGDSMAPVGVIIAGNTDTKTPLHRHRHPDDLLLDRLLHPARPGDGHVRFLGSVTPSEAVDPRTVVLLCSAGAERGDQPCDNDRARRLLLRPPVRSPAPGTGRVRTVRAAPGPRCRQRRAGTASDGSSTTGLSSAADSWPAPVSRTSAVAAPGPVSGSPGARPGPLPYRVVAGFAGGLAPAVVVPAVAGLRCRPPGPSCPGCNRREDECDWTPGASDGTTPCHDCRKEADNARERDELLAARAANAAARPCCTCQGSIGGRPGTITELRAPAGPDRLECPACDEKRRPVARPPPGNRLPSRPSSWWCSPSPVPSVSAAPDRPSLMARAGLGAGRRPSLRRAVLPDVTAVPTTSPNARLSLDS
ncbi:trypsin-like serine protease [Kitasatospora sp. NPDC057518]|uniref:trypsin-like serine protease n=1 Tax=Kitasatospora sp. NPDC057518 TaxID=3346155 RepID=UPI00368F17E4